MQRAAWNGARECAIDGGVECQVLSMAAARATHSGSSLPCSAFACSVRLLPASAAGMLTVQSSSVMSACCR